MKVTIECVEGVDTYEDVVLCMLARGSAPGEIEIWIHQNPNATSEKKDVAIRSILAELMKQFGVASVLKDVAIAANALERRACRDAT